MATNPTDAPTSQPELNGRRWSWLVNQILERLLEDEPDPLPVDLVEREEPGRLPRLEQVGTGLEQGTKLK